MKATYKRYLAAAFATVGLFSLGISQAQDPTVPSQQDTLGPTQIAPSQYGVYSPDFAQPSDVQSGQVNQGQMTTDLGINPNGTLDTTHAPKILINQTEVTFGDAKPGMINGQLMVPIRDLAEQMGSNVQWQNIEKQAIVVLPNQQSVTLNTNQDWLSMVKTEDQGRPLRFYNSDPEKHFMLGGSEVILIDNRAYMPFDKLASALNCTGDWDQNAETATIRSNQSTTGEDQQIPSGTGTPPDVDKQSGGTGLPPDHDLPPSNY